MRPATLIFTACAWLAAGTWAGPPKPAESDWLVTRNATFFIDGDARGRQGRTRFHLEFELRKPVTEPLFITVDFENPADPESPLFAEFEIAPGTTRFEAQSEWLPAIRNRHKYFVKVWIHADVKRRQLLGTHEQWVLFRMPRDLLEQLGIKLL